MRLRALFVCAFCSLSFAWGQETTPLAQAQQLLLTGKYEEALAAQTAALDRGEESEEWHLLKAEALERVGRWSEAKSELQEAMLRFPASLRLRVELQALQRATGEKEAASETLRMMERIAMRQRIEQTPGNRVALGRAAQLAGADPKQVLERVFDPVRKTNPDFRDVHLATAEMALAKHDFELAARTLLEAVKRFPEDPEVHYGLARAFASSDTERMLKALEKTLSLNPRHVGALQLQADHLIDAERYGEAREAIQRALAVDAGHPLSHAFQAVLANLANDPAAAETARAAALERWQENPEVDHLIGRKLSQKYRFKEGAARQRTALGMDGEFVPAQIQLAQDLLRLGEDQEGWALAQKVQARDPYDVVAYNLVTLKDSIAHFRTLESDHFILRMDPLEADVYGERALKLLENAYDKLCTKYGLQPEQKTIVELFPDQKDFAIRTFGLPGGAGYLGVCFGRVITANSPASRRGNAANWEAVLWHEFAHVVTLQLTGNKMPRWLSEGISVYEERLASGSWGERMKPRYRAMLLGEDLTPVSQLSSAFLSPKTPLHLSFAYYQSSLVVEWLQNRFGLDSMKALLKDLADGTTINEALSRHTKMPLEELDAAFKTHALALANGTAPKLDWSKPEREDLASPEAFEKWAAARPTNYTALMDMARRFIEQRDWDKAEEPLRKLIELYPAQHEPESAHALLAKIHRERGETEAEIAMLERHAELCADAPETFSRLMTLAAERQDWSAVLRNAERALGVDPLEPEANRMAGLAFEHLAKTAEAMAAYERVVRLRPTSPPDLHMRLAKLHLGAGDRAIAKKHTLLALENAPRYREALRFLRELSRSPDAP